MLRNVIMRLEKEAWIFQTRGIFFLAFRVHYMKSTLRHIKTQALMGRFEKTYLWCDTFAEKGGYASLFSALFQLRW